MTTTFEKRTEASSRAEYFTSHMSKIHPLQEKLIELTKQHPAGYMLGSADSIQLLTSMIRFAGAKRCLDVGVFTGYSALSWALSIPSDGKVVACELYDDVPRIGIPVWKEAGVFDKIDLRIAPAADTLQSLIDNGESGTYDFMFIDADKCGYDTYYELGLKLLRKDGIIAIDNTWFSGKLADPTRNDDNTVSIRTLNDKIKCDSRVTAVLVDIGDGVNICCKN